MADDPVIGMGQKFSIRDLLAAKAGPVEANVPVAEASPAPAEMPPDDGTWPVAEEFDPLPTPGDPYKAHSRAASKPVLTLHCLLADGQSRGFAWSGFDGIDWMPAGTAGGGPVIVLRLASLIPTEIVIEGRNLGQLHGYLGEARIGWIRELPANRRAFANGTEPVIERISFRPVQPPVFG